MEIQILEGCWTGDFIKPYPTAKREPLFYRWQ
jgi:hypothetical protein